MNILKMITVFFAAAVIIVACKKEDTNINKQLNDVDNNFVLLAGINNAAEVQTAKTAISKSTDTIVLSFAKQMLLQHDSAQSDLKIMGNIVGFTVKDTIDAAHAAIIPQLDTLTGRLFDSVYMHTELANLQAMTNLYTGELKDGRQLNVRAYANTNLQNIQINYGRADSIVIAIY